MAGGAKGGAKGGAGKASPAALYEDDPQIRRRATFNLWKKNKAPLTALFTYDKSPKPPSKNS